MNNKVVTKSGVAKYICQTLELNHNPFEYDKAEDEITVQSEYPPFFRYFVDPPYQGSYGRLLERLQEANNMVVFAPAGGGKTTLNYQLQQRCRKLAKPSLVVTQTLGKGEQKKSPAEALAQALATDLYVQTVERFDSREERAIEPLEWLAHFWQKNIPNFERNIKRDLDKRDSNAVLGIAARWWHIWQRPAVRYTPLSPNLTAFLEKVLKIIQDPTPYSSAATDFTFRAGLRLAAQLGYEQLFFLIDVVEAPARQEVDLEKPLADLVNYLLKLPPGELPIYLKCFWPLRLRETTLPILERLPNDLVYAIIVWDDPVKLKEVITNRFSSAGKSWIKGFDTLASENTRGELDWGIIQSANQSPRRLSHIAQALLAAHSEIAADEPTITLTDWDKMVADWTLNEPKPLSFSMWPPTSLPVKA